MTCSGFQSTVPTLDLDSVLECAAHFILPKQSLIVTFPFRTFKLKIVPSIFRECYDSEISVTYKFPCLKLLFMTIICNLVLCLKACPYKNLKIPCAYYVSQVKEPVTLSFSMWISLDSMQPLAVVTYHRYVPHL